MCVALLEIDLSSSGEHWGTSFLCKYGVIAQDGIERVSNNDAVLKTESREIVSTYLPYDYCYTASIPGDIHVSKAGLPEEIKAVLKDFRNCRVSLQYEQDAPADLYALGMDMMESFDFLIKMDAIMPGADPDSLQRIIEFAESLDEEGSRTKGEYLRSVFTEYDLAVRGGCRPQFTGCIKSIHRESRQNPRRGNASASGREAGGYSAIGGQRQMRSPR
jgi:hypothetical protein